MRRQGSTTTQRKPEATGSSLSRDDLMVQAAWMYYYGAKTQQEIADRLALSRTRVTRLLQAARAEGVVEIRLRPVPGNADLCYQVERAFGLRDAVIVNADPSPEQMLRSLGRAAAIYLSIFAPAGGVIGFGYSRTVSYMLGYTDLMSGIRDGQIVDLVGCNLGQENPYSISVRIADALHLPVAALPVPIVVRTESAYQTLLQDPLIQRALQLARRSQIAIIGVGEAGLQNSLVKGGYLTEAELEALRGQGVVGDALLRFYDIKGQPIAHEVNRRIVALTWDELKRLPHVVVVAAGDAKIAPILGILRSGLCHTLITDAQTAHAVIELDKYTREQP